MAGNLISETPVHREYIAYTPLILPVPTNSLAYRICLTSIVVNGS
jgi:hypothetical protein